MFGDRTIPDEAIHVKAWDLSCSRIVDEGLQTAVTSENKLLNVTGLMTNENQPKRNLMLCFLKDFPMAGKLFFPEQESKDMKG